jgi:murein DD-endopeptidase MepM/ murein hydrolase activator NlpD
VTALERELAASRDKLASLKAQYAEQTRLLALLRQQHDVAQERLARRLVELYETDSTDEVAILLQAGSIADVFEQVDYFATIARQDRKIAEEIARLQVEMRAARQRTAETALKVAAVTTELEAETAEETAARDELVSQQQALVSVRADKQTLLQRVRNTRDKDEEDLKAQLAASAAIASRIQSSQANAASQNDSPPPSGTSSSGFIWPVQGVITSPFGMRWGRMHEGIDIAAPIGTAIHAAASGIVIYAGWMGGYGNLVVIDHGNGLATAYGHQSAIYATPGHVEQGQVIGAVGSTGHSTGPHCHFEVRVNGVPVDPMRYL